MPKASAAGRCRPTSPRRTLRHDGRRSEPGRRWPQQSAAPRPSACNEETPTSGSERDQERACALAIPIRSPVNVPGPVPTAIVSSLPPPPAPPSTPSSRPEARARAPADRLPPSRGNSPRRLRQPAILHVGDRRAVARVAVSSATILIGVDESQVAATVLEVDRRVAVARSPSAGRRPRATRQTRSSPARYSRPGCRAPRRQEIRSGTGPGATRRTGPVAG